jgi:hypothetical protein
MATTTAKSKKMGAAANHTSRVVAIRLNHKAHNVLDKRAAALGYDSLGTYLREHLETQAKRKLPKPA